MIAAAAVLAGLLGWLAPSLLPRLPAPDPADGEPDAYLSVAEWRWLRPLVAGISALVVVALGARIGLGAPTWGLTVVTPLLIPLLILLAIVDARTRLLPRVPVLVATGLLLLAVVVDGVLAGSGEVVLRAVIAMLVARTLFWLLWALPGSGMGFGDVRLAALIGLALGRLGWTQLVVGLYAGVVLFSLWALGRAIQRRSWAALRQELPYGPFMFLGFVLGVLS